MAGDGNEQKGEKAPGHIDLRSEAERTEASGKADVEKAKAAPNLREQTLEAMKEEAGKTIGKSQSDLVSGDQSFDKSTQEYLENYFDGAIQRFDEDMDGKIDAGEAKDFKKKMRDKTNEIIERVKGGAENKDTMRKAAEKVSEAKLETANKSIESIEDIGDISDIEGANAELKTLQQQNQGFQTSIQDQLAKIQAFGTEFQKFQAAEEGFGHVVGFVKSIVASGERDGEIAAMKAKLEATKTAANQVLNDLTNKKKTLDANGEKIKTAIQKARSDAVEKRDETIKQVEKANKEQQDKIQERKKKYDELQEAKAKMQQRQKAIQGRQKKVAELRSKWKTTKTDARLDVKEKAYKEGGKDIDLEIQGYKIILGNPNVPPDYKKKIKLALEKAQERKGKSTLGLKVIALKRESGEEYEEQLDEKGKNAAVELQTVDGHLDRQEKTSIGLSNNIRALEELQLDTATKGEQVTEIYNKRIKTIDDHSKMVNNFMLDASVGRVQSLNALRDATNSLNSVTIKSKSFAELINPLNIVGNISKGIGGAFMSIAHALDGQVRDVLEWTREGGDQENGFLYGVTQFASIFTGFLSGASELVGGVFTLAGGLTCDIGSIPDAVFTWDSSKFHAFETLKGLGAIIGYDAAKGEFSFEKFGDTWIAMGGALIGHGTNWGMVTDPKTGQQVKREEYGTAVGKGVFNLLSMFIGVGEAGAAAKGGAVAARAGSATGKAAIAAEAARVATIQAAKAAGKTVGRFTGRGAQVMKFSTEFVKNIIKPKNHASAMKNARAAEGVVGKGWAYSKTVVGGGLKRAGGGIKKGWEATKNGFTKQSINVGKKTVERTPVGHAIRQMPRYAAKAAAEVAMFPYKMMWKTGKALRGRHVRMMNGRPTITASPAEEIARAGKIIEANADEFAKARTAIDDIISNDTALRTRANAINGNSPAARAKRLQLEAEACQKLLQKDPNLANAYLTVRKASDTLADEVASFSRRTREGANKILDNQAIKTEYDIYNRLREEFRNTPRNERAPIAKKIQEYEQNKARMANIRKYEAATQAVNELSDYTKQLDDLHDSLIGAQTTEASKLADEIAEAKRASAPAGTLEADLSRTRSPGFADDFVKKYDEALAQGGDDLADLEARLDTRHADSGLDDVLEGIRLRRSHQVPASPKLPKKLSLNQRKKLMRSYEKWKKSQTNADYNAYIKLRKKAGKKSSQYIDWMEERYRTLPVEEASKVILGDSQALAKALRINQELSLAKYQKFEDLIKQGVTKKRLSKQMKKANLPPEWQRALQQMRERYSFVNRHAEITGSIVLNRIKGEYPQIINAEMTAAEAAKKLQRRYGIESLDYVANSSSKARRIADEVKLADGTYKIKVVEDGSVRLFNKSDEMVLTKAEAKAIRGELGISAEMSAKEVADVLAKKYSGQGSHIGAGETRIVAKELVLKNGKKYTVKLTPDGGELQLFDDAGKQIKSAHAPVKAKPAAVPKATAAPAKAATKGQTKLQKYNARNRKRIDQFIDGDDTLKALRDSGDNGAHIARGKAEAQLYESSPHAKAVKAELQRLEDKINTSVGMEKVRAVIERRRYTGGEAYQTYKRYEALKTAFDDAEKAINQPGVASIVAEREVLLANKTKIQNATIPKLNNSKLSAQEAAEVIARESLEQRGILATAEDLGEVTLKGKKYSVKISTDGKFQLFDEGGNRVLTAAEEAALPPAPAVTSAAPATAPAGSRAPATLERFDPSDLTQRSFNGIKTNQTAVYRVGKNGQWIEITKLGDDQYRILQGGKRNPNGTLIDEVSDIAITGGRRGGPVKVSWKSNGVPGELDGITRTVKRDVLKTQAPSAAASTPARASTATPAAARPPQTAQALQGRVSTVEQQLKSQDGKVAQLEGELKAAQAGGDDLQKVQRKLDDAKTAADDLDARLKAAREDFANGVTTPTPGLSLIRRNRGVERLKNKITDTQQKLKGLKKRKKEVKVAEKREAKFVHDLEQARQALQLAQQGSRARYFSRRASIKRARAHIDRLNRDLKQVQKTLSGDSVVSIEGAINANKAKLEKLKPKLEKAKQNLIDDLEKQVQRKQGEIQQYEARVNASGGAGPRPIDEIQGELNVATREADKLRGDFAQAQKDLAKVTGTPVPGTVPAAAKKAAKAPKQKKGPSAAVTDALKKRQAAKELYRSSRNEIINLEERIGNLEEAIEARKATNASKGEIAGLQRTLDDLSAQKLRHEKVANTAAKDMGDLRGEYWSARYKDARSGISEKVQGSIDRIKDKSSFVGNVVEAGGKALTAPARYFWEALKRQSDQVSAAGFAKGFLFGRAGVEVARRMEELRAAAAPDSSVVNELLPTLAMDQYDALEKIEGDGTQKLGLPSREQFAAMSSEEQIEALGGGYSQLEGLEVGQEDLLYTEVERDYIKDKRETFEKTLAEVESEPDLTNDSVTAALDRAFGPQGLNDSRKGYEVTMEGVTMKVDAEGNRSYEGVEQWVKGAPTRKTVRGVLATKSTEYEEMSPKGLETEAEDKKIESAGDFQTHAEEQIKNSIIEKYNETGETPTAGTFNSKEKTESGEPRYTVNVDDDGKVEVEVNETWAAETYEGIKSRPEPAKPKPRMGARRGAPSSKAPEPKITKKPKKKKTNPNEPYA